MNKFLNYLLQKLSNDHYQSHVVMEVETLKEFFNFIIFSVSPYKQFTHSKSLLLGEKPTAFNGHGMDYSECKPYNPGDDIRSINWKQTAKSGELMSNTYYQEADNIEYILLDQRQSMYYGTRSQIKLACAIKIALLSSIISINNNKKVKILSISDTVSISEIIDSHNKALLYFLSIAKKDFTESSPDQINLSELFKYMLSLKPHYSSVNIISDFHDFNDECLKLVNSISQNNNVKINQVQDQIEKQLPFHIPVNYQSLSTNRSVTVRDPNKLKELNKAISYANNKIEHLLSSTGIKINRFDNDTLDKDILKAQAA